MLSLSCVRAAHTFQESLSFSPGIYFFPSEQAQPSVLVSKLPRLQSATARPHVVGMTFLYPLSFSNIVLMSVLLIWLQSFSTGFANTTVRCENHPSSFSHTRGCSAPLVTATHQHTRHWDPPCQPLFPCSKQLWLLHDL